MILLPSLLSNENSQNPTQDGVFGVCQDSYLPFATTQVNVGGGFQNQNQQNTSSISFGNPPPVFQNVDAKIFRSKGTISTNDSPPVNVITDDNVCTMQYDPICVGGKTYSNICQASKDSPIGFPFTKGECENSGKSLLEQLASCGINQPEFEPNSGCIIQGCVAGNNGLEYVFLDKDGKLTLQQNACQISPNFISTPNESGNENLNNQDEISNFIKKNWVVLIAAAAGFYLITKK